MMPIQSAALSSISPLFSAQVIMSFSIVSNLHRKIRSKRFIIFFFLGQIQEKEQQVGVLLWEIFIYYDQIQRRRSFARPMSDVLVVINHRGVTWRARPACLTAIHLAQIMRCIQGSKKYTKKTVFCILFVCF